MSSQKAVELYTAVPKTCNCAQAVAAGMERAELAGELGACGGGKAPGGLCGALYAALLLTPEEKHEEIRRRFREKAGAECCRELKQLCRFPCPECVRLGAELAEEFKR